LPKIGGEEQVEVDEESGARMEESE